ncbi:MAG TPA: sigma-70 family RNA polymerase sigma factor, partial [Solirubrobacterales bacterium]|nr:sigma-70 family RNA polymerase sigma factor [Solirubrobacterales bacterium]
DQRAFAAIYRRYHQGIYRFCLSILGRPEDAQEALQNTMVKALRSLPGEEREIQLKPWLYRVAHNESIDLVRKRREGPELDASRASGAAEIAETVALRERLGRLLADLGELPERQRSALVMRELAGLGYEQIGEAFDSSPSVARQTVYEARLSLCELEAGREMGCDQVTRQLSEADGRVTRRRDIQAHLRDCAECRAFRDSIGSRRQDLAALSPLPAALGASILSGLASGQAATSVGGGAVVAGAGAGAGKVAATSVVLKAAATVAVVATVGVTAADRGGLIDAGLPGGSGDNADGLEKQAGERDRSGAAVSSPLRATGGAGQRAGAGKAGLAGSRRAAAIAPAEDRDGSNASAPGRNSPDTLPGQTGQGASKGPPASLPDASRHGQETAAAHKAGKVAGSTKQKPAPPEHAQNEGTKSSGKGQSAKHPPSKQPGASPQPAQPEAKPDAPPGAEKAATAGGKPEASP